MFLYIHIRIYVRMLVALFVGSQDFRILIFWGYFQNNEYGLRFEYFCGFFGGHHFCGHFFVFMFFFKWEYFLGYARTHGSEGYAKIPNMFVGMADVHGCFFFINLFICICSDPVFIYFSFILFFFFYFFFYFGKQ